jgi:hypothetical protein
MTKLTPDQKDKRQTVRRERKVAKQERREVRERTQHQIAGGEKSEKDIGLPSE